MTRPSPPPDTTVGDADQLRALAEAIARAGVNSLTPQFPRAVCETENLGLYRNACCKMMRLWLKYSIADLVSFPADEHDARIVVEHMATQEIGRGLWRNETRLLAEAVRDLLTARTILRDLELADLRDRLHTPGRLFA